MRNVIAIVLTSLSLLCAQTAQAIPLTWNLDGVIFNDGKTLTGSFAFDADTVTLTNPLIFSDGSGLTYTALDTLATGSADGQLLLHFNLGLGGVDGLLALAFQSALTNGGGTVALKLFDGVDINSSEFYQGGAHIVVSGAVVSVPEPTSIALLGLALMGVAASRRSRHF